MTDERDDKDWFFLQSVLINLIGWGFFILFEFLEGKIHSNRGNGLLYGIFGIPILICILFCAMEWWKKSVHVNTTEEMNSERRVTGKSIIRNLITWFGTSFTFSFLINLLVMTDHWIILQNRSIFDGIEYGVFGIVWTVGCLVIFGFVYMIEWLVQRQRVKRMDS